MQHTLIDGCFRAAYLADVNPRFKAIRAVYQRHRKWRRVYRRLRGPFGGLWFHYYFFDIMNELFRTRHCRFNARWTKILAQD